MFYESQTVTSIGDGRDGVPIGSVGRILVLSSGNAGHVQWLDGPRRGEVTLISPLADSVAPSSSRMVALHHEPDGFEDSLVVGPITTTGTRHLLATGGASSVLTHLASMGAFADVADVGEQALAFVEAHLRRSGALHAHLAELDEEDQNDLYRLASRTVLSETLGRCDE
jgi:hypothetical protein